MKGVFTDLDRLKFVHYVCVRQETRNMVFGQTCNPYHTGRTVGGSSGGEAALAAALASPISLCRSHSALYSSLLNITITIDTIMCIEYAGSDIGGSTRMPAFYCGLFGLNPTAGTTSLKGALAEVLLTFVSYT